MWICQNQAFLSIVASKDPASLSVRARRKGDIEEVFGTKYEVFVLPGRDYGFRALIPREVVGVAIAESISKIDYSNFKDSVADAALHDAYMRVWNVMEKLQEIPAYSTKPRPGFAAHPVRRKG
ncbi:hypothetical protein GCM10027093_08540 [Paraburkholderia jirisanensis]